MKQLSSAEQEAVANFEKKHLVFDPYVGDHLGYPFFREKKLSGKRVYFLIYDDVKIVLMVSVSDKKAQHDTIEEIKLHLKDYYALVKEVLTRHGGYGHA